MTARKGPRFPPAKKEWPEDVRKWYAGYKNLPHFEEMTETDVYQLRVLFDLLSDAMGNKVEINAAHYKNILTQLNEFGGTISGRRKMSIEQKIVENEAEKQATLATLHAAILGGS